MEQIKIGKFIAEKRKSNNLTQAQLAEKLNITDRAISKWENGRSMPDSSIMIDLCNELKISVNELLSGEEIKKEDYKNQAEENLLKLEKEIEEKDKQFFNLEIFIGYLSSLTFLILIFIASYVELKESLRLLLVVIASIILAVGVSKAIKIEQFAGYYECQKCHYKYVPKYQSVFWAMHIGRTRYMKCPKCKERSWQRKVIKRT